MFTGIVETMGELIAVNSAQNNMTFLFRCNFQHELRIDQSLAHNGVCLTVDGLYEDHYSVTAIHETLSKTNLGTLQIGDRVNLERCMQMNGRLDGHIVQGHVDCTGTVTSVQAQGGSHLFTIQHPGEHVTVEKGSVTVNGVSLTVVDSNENTFSVAIIPYTFNHTTFGLLKPGDPVNIEFDIIGKYIEKLYQRERR